MERKPLVSPLALGLFLALLSGYAWAGGGEGVDTMPAEQATDALRGEELPFPVGWVPENALPTAGYQIEGPTETGALPEPGEASFELRGTELPFPVGWVPESALPAAGYEIEGPSETGALPGPGEASFELRGTELPFPVGWVPE